MNEVELKVDSYLPIFSQSLFGLTLAANIKQAVVVCSVCNTAFSEFLSLVVLGSVISYVRDARSSLYSIIKRSVFRAEESCKNMLQSTSVPRLLRELQATALKYLFKMVIICMF